MILFKGYGREMKNNIPANNTKKQKNQSNSILEYSQWPTKYCYKKNKMGTSFIVAPPLINWP